MSVHGQAGAGKRAGTRVSGGNTDIGLLGEILADRI